ncbi:hypothetical protein CLPU_11c00420 [Gottschalkia purinilytica]|uniref:Uncharacterized protein n=1 Tax=Gottschalkia purinilytica TaxID=1503 RepID=A0A0L0W8H6_GOTPU|nr:hypothetical protein [Gottschalkia purinilytica]KNF07873.1 hypothetical protein CLPU_11c00420 [Gottschalkia purinilytica]
MSKRVSSIILASLVLTLGVSGGHAKSDKDNKKKELKTLTVSTFEEDLHRKNVFEPFEKKYNVKVVLELEKNFERLNKLRNGDSKADVALFTDYYAMKV